VGVVRSLIQFIADIVSLGLCTSETLKIVHKSRNAQQP